MNWKSIDDRLPPSLKAEVWVGRNFVKVLIGSFLIAVMGLLFGLYASKKNNDAIMVLSQALAEMSNKVVVLTPDGRVAQIEKSTLNQEQLKIYLYSFVLTNLVFDKFSFMRDKIYAPNPDKIPSYSDQVGRALKMSLFDKKRPQGFRNFRATVEYLWSLGKADQLPEIVKPIGVEEEEFRYNPQTREFTYRVRLVVAVTYFTVKKEWKTAKGSYTVELAGYFNPLMGIPTNPFGMKLTYLKIEPVKKPRA